MDLVFLHVHDGKTSYWNGSSASELSECVGTYFLICSVFVQPRQVLNYYFIILSLHAWVRDIQDLVVCTQQVLAKKFLVITLQVQSCNTVPSIQCQQGDILSNSTWDLCVWLCTGMATWLEKNIYPCMNISHIYAGWTQTADKLQADHSKERVLNTNLLSYPSPSLPVYKNCWKILPLAHTIISSF